MKRILFPILLIVTLLAGGLVAFAIWRTSPASAEDDLLSGKKAIAERNYEEASIYLLRAVSKDERNRDARFLLSQSYLSKGDVNSAVKQLRTLLEYYPTDKEANVSLGNLYLRFANGDEKAFDEVAKIAKKLIILDETHVDAHLLAGNAAASLKEYDEALTSFQKAISLDPKNIPGYISLGTTQAILKAYPEAEKAFLKAREVDPKNVSALLALANYYRSMKETKKAEDIYKAALELHPAELGVYGPLVGMYNDLGRIDEAIRLLNELQAKDLKNPIPSIMLSDLFLLQKKEADAQRVLLDIKKTNPDNLDVAGKLAVLFMRPDPKRAREEIDQILKVQPKNPIGLVLLGESQYWLGQIDEAKATLSEPQVANSAIPDAQYFLGAIAVKQGQFDAAEEHYRKALQLKPDYLLARAALAGVLLDKGRTADARIEITRVMEANKNFAPARLVKVAVDMREKKFAGVEQELIALAKDQPSNADIQMQLGAFYASQSRNADAEKAYLRSVEIQPDSIPRLQELVRFYTRIKQPEKGLERIASIPEGQKKAGHYELIGNIYSQMGKIQDAEAAYTKAVEKDPKSPADAAIAALYIQAGRSEDGLRKLDELIQKNPANGGAHAIKGVIYENQGKMADAKQSYTRALQIDGNSDIAANNLAYMLAEEGRDLDTALSWAQAAKKRNPNVAGIADTLGWVYYKMGNHSQARDQLLFALSKEPTNPVFHYHLGMIYLGDKQPKLAADALRKAVNSPGEYKERPLAQKALQDATK
jgi:tetratricopeptide (TPR) repeat protein